MTAAGDGTSAHVRVCSLDDVALGDAARFDVEGLRLAVVRVGSDEVRVIGDRCSHADYSLAAGDVDLEACTIECWRHGAVFSLRTGEPETLPATRPVPVYSAEVRDGDVWVTVDGDDGRSAPTKGSAR